MKNMKKRGFTLIELLAVIVILAIIAFIAVPTIFNTIEKSKVGAFKQTITNVAKAAKFYQAKVQLNDKLTECRYFSFSDDVTEVTLRNGKKYYPLKELSMKGSLPTEGEIKICDEIITINAGNGSYSGTYEDDETTVVEGGLADNDFKSPIIDVFNTTSTRESIIVIVSAHSQSIGGIITNYYYKIDDGEYIKTTEKSHVFEGLESGHDYTITVMVENKSGVKTDDSKTVTTKSFGELTINVEKSNEWTSSKNVTITGTTEEYKIEYNVRKYNEETKEIEESGFLEYADTFTLDTIATTKYPTLIIARYNDNGAYSNEKTYTVVNIDTSSPTNTLPAVNVSTTKPTSEASVVIRQVDEESGLDDTTIKYGYSTKKDGTYTWQTSPELKKLVAGTTYYVKTRVTNNVGKEQESEVAEYTPGKITTCSVTPLTSGWATNKDVEITGTQTGTELQYQIGATKEDGWTTIKNNGTINIEENTRVYCRLWDGTTAGATGTGIIEQIDREEPELELKVEEVTTNSVVIPFTATDAESGPATATCKYGTSTSYDKTGTVNSSNNSCTISGLTSGTTYYYQICVKDIVGNGPVCVEGNTKPASMESPQILFDNTPDTSVNGYYREQTAKVTYVGTGITSPRYFVKTTIAGTSSITVTKSCGTGDMPGTSCTTITGTTSLAANTWYEVSGNVNVTYNKASSTTGTIYATTYDGTNFITPSPAGTLSKIDVTKPELTLGSVTTTTNSATIGYTATDAESGPATATCKYSSTSGSYTTNGTVNSSNNSCTISGLTSGTTYYYQICVKDKVGNGTTCKTGNTSPVEMPSPSIEFTNTPDTAVNGYLDSQVAHVTYTATGITSPRYFVKTTIAGTSSITVTKSCGTGDMPGTSCTTITGTTSLAANTWYEVSGNVNVTYTEYSSTTGTIYAAIYDGTNFIDPIPTGTIRKITKETNYTVNHYQMNTDMTNYTLAETETLSGKVGYSVTPSVKTYTGFNSPATQTVTLADGSTVVNYYYTRKQVTVTFYRNHSTSDTTTATQTFTYGVSGQSFSDKGWSRTGYTLAGWSTSATGTYNYEKLSVVSNSWINSNSPSTKIYAVWVVTPTVTFAHSPSSLVNGYAKSTVATVTYSSTNVKTPVYYIKTTRAGTSSVAVTQSCGTSNSPGTCTTITSTTSLAANTWYKISGNTTVTYNTTASSTDTILAYTYDGTAPLARGSGTVPMIDATAPTCGTYSGGSTKWTNVNRTISVTCSDTGGSGCTKTSFSNTFSSNTTTAGAGITISDAVGNTNSCNATQNIYIDKTKPTCGTYSGGSTKWTNVNRTISVTCSDTGGSGCTKTSFSNTFSSNATTAGAGITISDVAGNTNSCNATQNIYIDKTAPTCTSSGGSASWTSSSRTLVGTCSDTGGSGCTGNVSWLINWEGNWSNLSPGKVYDNAGNSVDCPANQTVRVDTTNPTVTINSSSATTNSITVNYTLSDSRSGIGNYTCKYLDASTAVSVSAQDATYTTSAQNVTSTSCTMTGLKSNTTYYVQICATDNVARTTCKYEAKKTASVPTNLKVIKHSQTSYCSGGSSLALTTASGFSGTVVVQVYATNATYYQVCTSSSSGCSNLSTVSGTCATWGGTGGSTVGQLSYTANQGNRYFRACNANGCTSSQVVYIK